MLRRSQTLTATALALLCVAAPTAGASIGLAGQTAPPPSSIAQSDEKAYQDLRSPDAVDAAGHRGLHEADKAPYTLNRDYGSPDAVDAAREVPQAQGQPGPFTEAERTLVESPEVQQMLHDISRSIGPVVEVDSPSNGFDWGDAGIGAAGMLALFGIAGGSALLLTGRKRRRAVRVAH
jgi:hypothetical protein